MKYILNGNVPRCLFVLICILSFNALRAQTDIDAITMAKNNLCVGPMYSYSSWRNYWEGTYKRDNLNLGRVSTQMIGLMGSYGVTKNLNALFSVPYVKTKASGGTMQGMSGIQDLSLWLKWQPLKTKVGKGTFSLFGIGGVATPLSDYVADYLPLSIGMRATTLSARVMADYHIGKFFVTGSGTYTHRTNVKIDRTSYYTTESHLTNRVEMPDVASFNFRTGLRSKHLIAELILANMTTLGGFDIRKNDMPFPSNRMVATTAGVNVKYTVHNVRGLELIASGNRVIAGRNVGQATAVNGGIFYIIDFSPKTRKVITNTKAI
jgi:hypothetical protein